MSGPNRLSPIDGLSPEALTGDAAALFAEIRRTDPVVWAPTLDSWIVTGYSEAVRVMRDADRFTVDDPRFTTAGVLGRSMLSVDGAEHRAHRAPFVEPFGRNAVRSLEAAVDLEARRLTAGFAPEGTAEMRTALAAPLAANTIVRVLGLDVDPRTVLDWYRRISDGIVDLADQRPLTPESRAAAADLLALVVDAIRAENEPRTDRSLLSSIADTSDLAPPVLAPSAAIVLFGAIETSEGMTANALWHLLTSPEWLNELANDRGLVTNAIEESLRLEPAAALLDRYATTDLDLAMEPAGGPPRTVPIRAGDQVTICLAAANRDPLQFEDPDRFDVGRINSKRHLAFAQGPHSCLGAHLARAETAAAVNAVLDLLPGLKIAPGESTPPSGRVFRKPERLTATWG